MTRRTRIGSLARRVILAAAEREIRVAAAESCTGGMVAAALTSVPGASSVLDRSFVAYSNEAKTEMLGVPAALIEKRGAVSGEVAAAMAEGALVHSRANLAVAVTGVAGPTGGSAEKPVGLVWFAIASSGRPTERARFLFDEPPGARARQAIRNAATETALQMLAAALKV